MCGKIIFIDVKLNLIQQIRLVQALSETDYVILVKPSEIYKLKLLRSKFGMQFLSDGKSGINLTAFTNISHEKPEVSIGCLKRPLIFPVKVAEYCKSIWVSERKFRYTFTGLITSKRESLLSEWIGSNIGRNAISIKNDNLITKIKKALINYFNLDFVINNEIGCLLISNSSKGRNFPGKSWDESYFRTLCNSEFVLCPSGDFVWSYRFFEAILCGAIPIIESYCEAYDGFKFYYMNNNAQSLTWTREIAEYNYKLCLDRITISHEILSNELNNIWIQHSGRHLDIDT